jgi:aryl-alcohol dehydrogenase-like predicted oxidoreductase
MTLGREVDEAESRRILDRFVDAGGTFIDTADVYSRGGSEEVIGRWLAGRRRDDLVIATKVRGAMGDSPNQVGLSRKHILEAVDASLRRLGTDYIDLYQMHSWDSATPLDETLSTLQRLIESGKVRYIGASNYPAWGLQKAIDLSRQMGWEQFVSLQPLYNLLDRDIEMGLVDVCRNEGLGIITWSPLRGGWLSGKYRRGMDAPPEGTRIARSIGQNWSEAWDKYNNERTWRILDGVLATATEVGKTPAQVSLRWVLQRPGITAPIIGARTVEQLEENLGAVDWSLSSAQMEQLNRVSEPTLIYPYSSIRPRT